MRILEIAGIAALTCFFFTGVAAAQEKKIKRSDLPSAVEKSVTEVSKGATIKGFSKETDKGATSYEVEMLVNGHTKDVEIDPSGAIKEVEEQVSVDSLSAAVKSGLTAKAAGGKILKVESISKNGQLVAYEARVQNAHKKSEIQVGPDGKPLDHEE